MQNKTHPYCFERIFWSQKACVALRSDGLESFVEYSTSPPDIGARMDVASRKINAV